LNAAVATNRLLFQLRTDPLESNNARRYRAERDMPFAVCAIVVTTLEAAKAIWDEARLVEEPGFVVRPP